MVAGHVVRVGHKLAGLGDTGLGCMRLVEETDSEVVRQGIVLVGNICLSMRNDAYNPSRITHPCCCCWP